VAIIRHCDITKWRSNLSWKIATPAEKHRLGSQWQEVRATTTD